MKPMNLLRMAKINTTNLVTLPDVNASHEVLSPFNASAGFTVGSGSKNVTQSPPSTNLGAWLTGDVASNYEVRLVPTSGTISSGPSNVWLSMSSDRAWSLTRTNVGFSSFEGILQIRRASDGTILDTSDVILIASVDF
jgi:hypothetical protein